MTDPDAPGDHTPPRTNWLAVSALVVAAVAAAFQIGKAPSALPVMRAELGLSLDEGVWIISIFNLLGITLGMIAGAFGDRLGHRRLIAFGFLAMAAASFAGATAEGFSTILAGRVLEGLGFIVVASVAPPLLMRFGAPRHQRLIFGIYSGYWPAGVAVMILVTPMVMGAVGWRGLWHLNGILVLAVMLFVLWATRAPGEPAAASGPAPLGQALRTFLHRGPMLLAVTFGVYSSIHVTVVALLPTFYTEADTLGLGAASALAALVAVVNVGGNLVAGIAMYRGVSRTLLIVGTFALIAASALLMYDDGLGFGVRLSAAIFLSFIAGMIPACLFAATPIMAPAPTLVGATTGLMMQGSQLGQLVGPVAMAWVVTATGSWDFGPVTLVVAAAAGILLAFALRGIERRTAPQPGLA
ncbi:MAG: MFS transporter [Alphaproteobacteria bacterium]|nr:MFS transporter [Alphaproteobacteria bacterium]